MVVEAQAARGLDLKWLSRGLRHALERSDRKEMRSFGDATLLDVEVEGDQIAQLRGRCNGQVDDEPLRRANGSSGGGQQTSASA
jgi:hypothetical protein